MLQQRVQSLPHCPFTNVWQIWTRQLECRIDICHHGLPFIHISEGVLRHNLLHQSYVHVVIKMNHLSHRENFMQSTDVTTPAVTYNLFIHTNTADNTLMGQEIWIMTAGVVTHEKTRKKYISRRYISNRLPPFLTAPHFNYIFIQFLCKNYSETQHGDA